MKKIILTVLGLFLLWASHPAFGGGRFFVGLGTAPLFFPGTLGFLHHPRARAGFFFQLGPQPFSTFHLVPGGPWGYQYSAPTAVPYPIAPQDIPQRGFSGSEASGGLYVDGYRVLPSGWLRVKVEPSDATVLIDGFPVALNQTGGTSASKGLAVGSHQIEVYKAGLQKYQTEVEVKQAREIFVRIKLDE